MSRWARTSELLVAQTERFELPSQADTGFQIGAHQGYATSGSVPASGKCRMNLAGVRGPMHPACTMQGGPRSIWVGKADEQNHDDYENAGNNAVIVRIPSPDLHRGA